MLVSVCDVTLPISLRCNKYCTAQKKGGRGDTLVGNSCLDSACIHHIAVRLVLFIVSRLLMSYPAINGARFDPNKRSRQGLARGGGDIAQGLSVESNSLLNSFGHAFLTGFRWKVSPSNTWNIVLRYLQTDFKGKNCSCKR